ncbi:hypothetical protein CKAH01_17466 [Colletotrichum kahawae]|uniref:Uncharacterized protein n=1 Tax=Colletotrichum kahawae TaxID=34407 RepID=A0AAD9YBH2_COLKA|nr:hypothetical protein CKAH01_17466 [Colletotrichum kahawae]
MAAFVSHHLPLLFSLHLPRPSLLQSSQTSCLPACCLPPLCLRPIHRRIAASLRIASRPADQRNTPENRESSGQLSPPTTTSPELACLLSLSLPSSRFGSVSTHQPRHNLTCRTLFPLLQLRRLSLALHPNGLRLVCLSAATLTCPAASSAAAAACHLASIVYPPPTARLTSPCFA